MFEDMEGKTIENKIAEDIIVFESKVTAVKTAIAEEVERQYSEVSTYWEDKRLDIVPGDLLIDMVYRRYGVRFYKERADVINDN